MRRARKRHVHVAVSWAMKSMIMVLMVVALWIPVLVVVVQAELEKPKSQVTLQLKGEVDFSQVGKAAKAIWNKQPRAAASIIKQQQQQQQEQPLALPPPPPSKKATAATLHNVEDGEVHEVMSAPTAIANVLADLCPHGMLPIAYGMSAAGGTGPVLSILILIVFGALSWYSLVSFARAAEVVIVQDSTINEHQAGESLSSVWKRTVPNGEQTAWIPDVGSLLLTVGCLLFYSAFIGDLFGSLASRVPLPAILQKRWTVLLLLHAMPILPLCLKKDLSALKYSSMTGLLGVFYTIFFVGKRLVDQSYSSPDGKWFQQMPIHLQPAAQAQFVHDAAKTGALGYVTDMPPFHAGRGLLVLMNMCCVAYACHYNAVKYYMELQERTLPNLKGVMAAGIGGTAFVFGCMMILGYATFGKHSQALLLNNYHNEDIMAVVARAFTGVAIISGYALMFAGLKAALFSLLGLDQPNVKQAKVKQTTWSVCILSAIAVGACFVTEHELATVIGVVGSIFGSVVIYMFPAFINNSLLKLKNRRGQPLAKPFFEGEAVFNRIMLVFGIVFAILGTWISFQDL